MEEVMVVGVGDFEVGVGVVCCLKNRVMLVYIRIMVMILLIVKVRVGCMESFWVKCIDVGV